MPTLGYYLRHGSNATVGRSLSEGGTEGDALRALSARFGDATPDQLDQLYQRGLQSWQAAQVYGANDPAFPLTSGQVPAGGGLPCGYNFYVQYSVQDGPNGEITGANAVVPFDTIPDMEAFAAAVEQTATDDFSQGPMQGNDRYDMEDPLLVEFTITSVERGVC